MCELCSKVCFAFFLLSVVEVFVWGVCEIVGCVMLSHCVVVCECGRLVVVWM